MTYQTLLIIHLIAVIALVGPQLLAPRWLELMHTQTGRHALHTLHQQTAIAGWTVLIAGLVLVYLTHWVWLTALWLQLSVALYICAQAIDHGWADAQERRIEAGERTATVALSRWLTGKAVIYLVIAVLMVSKPTLGS